MNLALESANTLAISLSRKNLEGLLWLLDNKDETPQAMRRIDDGRQLIIIAEENDVHYNDARVRQNSLGVSGATAWPVQSFGEVHEAPEAAGNAAGNGGAARGAVTVETGVGRFTSLTEARSAHVTAPEIEDARPS